MDARCLVVMYHYVHDHESCVSSGVGGLSSFEFRTQLDELLARFDPIDWPTLYAALTGGSSMPHRSFLLTFDDGLADHVETVVPILRERGLRGTFFIPGAVLTGQRLLSAHALQLLLSIQTEEELADEFRSWLAEHDPTRDWFGALDRPTAEQVYHYETPPRAHLKYLLHMVVPPDVRNAAVRDLFEKLIGSERRWAKQWYLTWDHLREMESQGHTIGGHGFSHEPLGQLTPGQRRGDLRRVMALLGEGLGPDLRPLSYPFGNFDDDTCRASASAGFVHAFTTQEGLVGAGSDPTRLPRVDTNRICVWLSREAACR